MPLFVVENILGFMLVFGITDQQEDMLHRNKTVKNIFNLVEVEGVDEINE